MRWSSLVELTGDDDSATSTVAVIRVRLTLELYSSGSWRFRWEQAIFLDDDAGKLHTATQHILLESGRRIERRLNKGGTE